MWHDWNFLKPIHEFQEAHCAVPRCCTCVVICERRRSVFSFLSWALSMTSFLASWIGMNDINDIMYLFSPVFEGVKEAKSNQFSRGCLYNVTLPNLNATKNCQCLRISVTKPPIQNSETSKKTFTVKLQIRRQQDINSEWLENQSNPPSTWGWVYLSEIHLWYTQPMTKSPTSTHQSVPWLLRTSGKFQQLGSHERQIYRVMMWCDIWIYLENCGGK